MPHHAKKLQNRRRANVSTVRPTITLGRLASSDLNRRLAMFHHNVARPLIRAAWLRYCKLLLADCQGLDREYGWPCSVLGIWATVDPSTARDTKSLFHDSSLVVHFVSL